MRRTAVHIFPVSPFDPLFSVIAFHIRCVFVCGDGRMSTADGASVLNRFIVSECIAHSNVSVYRATDERTSGTVVIKAGASEFGCDQLCNERRILSQRLKGCDGVPILIASDVGSSLKVLVERPFGVPIREFVVGLSSAAARTAFLV